MATGRRISTTARTDDRAIVLPVSVALMLAAGVLVYAQAADVFIPAWGTDAEQEWDAEIAGAFFDLRTLMHAHLNTLSPVASSIPSAPEPRALQAIFLGSTRPLRADGTLSFEPDCGRWDATHVVNGTRVTDFLNGSEGCIGFTTSTVYTSPYTYRLEHGGIVRQQGDGAALLAGPPLDLEVIGPQVRVSLGLAGIVGGSASVTGSGVAGTIELTPLAASAEPGGAPNADRLEWNITTSTPRAWKSWFADRFDAAGFTASRAAPAPGESSADYVITCAPADCRVGPDGMGLVTVTVEGPRTDTLDIDLAIAYGVHDVALD